MNTGVLHGHVIGNQAVSEQFSLDPLRRLPLLSIELEDIPEALGYRRHYSLDMQLRHPGVQMRLGHFPAAGYQIATQLWLPEQPRATLLMLHGYYDHMGLYRHVVDWALGLDLAVLACDLPGHGLSDGPRASINDFAEYQQVLAGLLQQARRLALPQPLHLIGQSTGAAILLDHLLGNPQIDGLGQVMLLAPLVRPLAWNRGRLSYQLLRPFVKSIRRRFTDNSNDRAFLDFVRQHDPLQPRSLPTAWVGALSRWIPRIEQAKSSVQRPIIIQGEADGTVDWRHNLEVLADKFPGAERLLLPEARHHLANEREDLRQHYFGFLGEHLT